MQGRVEKHIVTGIATVRWYGSRGQINPLSSGSEVMQQQAPTIHIQITVKFWTPEPGFKFLERSA